MSDDCGSLIRAGYGPYYHSCKDCLPSTDGILFGTIWKCSCGTWYRKDRSFFGEPYSYWHPMTWWERFKARRTI